MILAGYVAWLKINHPEVNVSGTFSKSSSSASKQSESQCVGTSTKSEKSEPQSVSTSTESGKSNL